MLRSGKSLILDIDGVIVYFLDVGHVVVLVHRKKALGRHVGEGGCRDVVHRTEIASVGRGGRDGASSDAARVYRDGRTGRGYGDLVE